MTDRDRHDAWDAGSSYDIYMGRWSRQVAPRFLDWLDAPDGRRWLDVGSGTGALSAAILAGRKPQSLIAVEPSESLLAQARANVTDGRAEFLLGDAQDLPLPDASVDVVASALVLNFVPDRNKALSEMRRVAAPGGTIGFYVWDYPGGGMQLMQAFWEAANALDPKAGNLSEDRRFPFCTRQQLVELASASGLDEVRSCAIEIPTVFTDFHDYWHPFTLGVGPAPSYCTSLAPELRQRLRDRLDATLPRGADGSIPLTAKAWAVRGSTP